MKEKVEFERFEAKGKDGRIFIIVGYQWFITHTPVYGRSVVLKGDIEYWTDCGFSVRKIDSTTFRVFTLNDASPKLLERSGAHAAGRNAVEVYASPNSE